MAMILPEPINPTQIEATAFLRKLEERLDLIAGTSLATITQRAYDLAKEGNISRRGFQCAGTLLVQYKPIVSSSEQWSMLVLFHCTPLETISANAVYLSFFYPTILRTLHSVALTVKPATLAAFKQAATNTALPYLNRAGLPHPPILNNDIFALRAGYSNLAKRLYLP